MSPIAETGMNKKTRMSPMTETGMSKKKNESYYRNWYE